MRGGEGGGGGGGGGGGEGRGERRGEGRERRENREGNVLCRTPPLTRHLDPPVRRSTRPHARPRRLIEEITF